MCSKLLVVCKSSRERVELQDGRANGAERDGREGEVL